MDNKYVVDKVINGKGYLGTWNNRKGNFEKTSEDIINFITLFLSREHS